MNWHSVKIPQLCTTYGTSSKNGLVEYRAGILKQKFGANKLSDVRPAPFYKYLTAQLGSALNIVMLFLSAFMLLCGLIADFGNIIAALIILLLTVVNLLLGAFSEYSSTKTLKPFADAAEPMAKVIRGGVTRLLPEAELVPGDLIILEQGDRVPADARLTVCENLRCDEEILTGQRLAVEKDAEAILEDNTPLPDRINMVYMGCMVCGGNGRAIVTATGAGTELGGAAICTGNPQPSPVRRGLSRLGVLTAILLIVLFALLVLYSKLKNIALYDMTQIYGLVAAAIVPECLLIATVSALWVGVRRLTKKSAVISKLGSVDILGRTSAVCLGKNGTLTQNKMEVRQLWSGGKILNLNVLMPESAISLLKLATLCCTAVTELDEENGNPIGNATEAAIIEAAKRNGMKKSKLDEEFPRIYEQPFDPERKMMTTVNIIDGSPVAIVKGAYESIMPLCANGILEKAEKAHGVMCDESLRVIAVAYKPLKDDNGNISLSELENGLIFAGLLGMIDPPRADAKQTVEDFQRAGIRTVLITGDNLTVSCAVAKHLGIIKSEQQSITGAELELFTDEELESSVNLFSVYARVSPTQKARIVNALKARSNIVTMIGRGISDLPALRAANIGCCIEEMSTEPVRSSCDLIITSNSLHTAYDAICEGRGISDNIQKIAKYLMSVCFGEVAVLLTALLLNIAPLFTLPQILLFNLLVCLLPALGLGFAAPEPDIMKKQPRRQLTRFTSSTTILVSAVKGLILAATTAGAYYIGSSLFITDLMDPAPEVGVTMAVLTFILMQIGLCSCCRTKRFTLTLGAFSNAAVTIACISTALIAVLIGFVPLLREVFALISISPVHWVCAAGLAFAGSILLEFIKIFTFIYRAVSKHG